MQAEAWEQRLAAIEDRLARLEALLAEKREPNAVEATGQPVSAVPASGGPVSVPHPLATAAAAHHARYGPLPGARSPAAAARPASTSTSSPATLLLGWGGALALVLAAAYLIRLAIETGWLTPVSQVLMAVAVAFGMIVAGFRLKVLDARYAGFLPAAGIAVLFMAVYGAHHFFALIGYEAAATAVVAVCLGSLWLGRAFSSDIYPFFAVVGSYAVPVLMSSPPSVTAMTGYFLAWALVFTGFAVWQSRRQVYLLATVLGALVLAWCFDGRDEAWRTHSLLQAGHLLVLWSALFLVSRRQHKALTLAESLKHVGPLMLFYGIQFVLWDSHQSEIMVWIMLLPALPLLVIHVLEKSIPDTAAEGSQALLWWWLAVWVVHALCLETLSVVWQPWLACAVLPLVALLLRVMSLRPVVLAPLWLAGGLLYVVTLLRLLSDDLSPMTPAMAWLLPLFALQGWALWWGVRGTAGRRALQWTGLLVGHLAAMGAVLDLVSVAIIESALWAMLALAWIAVARRCDDLIPAQSALPVFALAAGKVLFYDLSDAAPLARIASLAVIGVSFYAGGLFYQRSASASREKRPS